MAGSAGYVLRVMLAFNNVGPDIIPVILILVQPDYRLKARSY